MAAARFLDSAFDSMLLLRVRTQTSPVALRVVTSARKLSALVRSLVFGKVQAARPQRPERDPSATLLVVAPPGSCLPAPTAMPEQLERSGVLVAQMG